MAWENESNFLNKQDRFEKLSCPKGWGQVYNVSILKMHLILLAEFGGKGER